MGRTVAGAVALAALLIILAALNLSAVKSWITGGPSQKAASPAPAQILSPGSAAAEKAAPPADGEKDVTQFQVSARLAGESVSVSGAVTVVNRNFQKTKSFLTQLLRAAEKDGPFTAAGEAKTAKTDGYATQIKVSLEDKDFLKEKRNTVFYRLEISTDDGKTVKIFDPVKVPLIRDPVIAGDKWTWEPYFPEADKLGGYWSTVVDNFPADLCPESLAKGKITGDFSKLKNFTATLTLSGVEKAGWSSLDFGGFFGSAPMGVARPAPQSRMESGAGKMMTPEEARSQALQNMPPEARERFRQMEAGRPPAGPAMSQTPPAPGSGPASRRAGMPMPPEEMRNMALQNMPPEVREKILKHRAEAMSGRTAQTAAAQPSKKTGPPPARPGQTAFQLSNGDKEPRNYIAPQFSPGGHTLFCELPDYDMEILDAKINGKDYPYHSKDKIRVKCYGGSKAEIKIRLVSKLDKAKTETVTLAFDTPPMFEPVKKRPAQSKTALR
jgi:hypothetical protein